MKEYKWATLGCGVIANELAQALDANGRKLYAVANRTHEKAVAFAERYGIEKVYDQIDDVFDDDEVDIIYISTPHNTHISYLRKALRAGVTAQALAYEVADMEAAVSGQENRMHLDYTIDVMRMMTAVRKDWGMTYPEEE